MFRQQMRREEEDLDEQLEERFIDGLEIDEIDEVMNEIAEEAAERHGLPQDDEDQVMLPPRAKKARIRTNVDDSFIKALMADNSSSGTPDGKNICLYKTLLLFKCHLQNSLSIVQDPSYHEKVQEWKKTLEKNEVNPGKLLELFQGEMKSFVETLTPGSSVQMRGMELLADVLSGRSSFRKQLPSKKQYTPVLVEGVEKGKQTMCRACGNYFVKSSECAFICPKEECQDRKCKECNEDRVCFRTNNCCKACFQAK